MSATKEEAKLSDTVRKQTDEPGLMMEIVALREEIKILKGRLRSIEYTSNLEREAYKRELSGAYDETNMLRRERNLLKKQLDEIMKPPMLIGEIIEVMNGEEVIIKNGTGQTFITTISNDVNIKELEIGSRVGLDRNNLVVMRALTRGKDPIIMGSELLDRPSVTYDDIGGLDDAIIELKEVMELPLLDPKVFRKIGIKPPNGVLLVGPPGTGKTLLAKAVANSAGCTFIRIVGSELVQKFIGEGGRLVRELFQLAREKKPCIIFIDELDAIGARRLGMDTTGDREVQRTLMQLLAEMDGFHPLEEIGIMAATNRRDIIDEALLRPGRFDRIIEIPLPDRMGRMKILLIHTRGMKLAKNVDLDHLADRTEDLSGADLRNLCTEAGMFTIRRGHHSIKKEDLEDALEKIRKMKDQNNRDPPYNMFH
ncbi:MAG: proteasome-activating nucleotidase [Candidatus Thermoplasmatota archaeon]|nr:proteasome-activating nucleotidase [Candidatus Thermoplasmatota archaeon]